MGISPGFLRTDIMCLCYVLTPAAGLTGRGENCGYDSREESREWFEVQVCVRFNTSGEFLFLASSVSDDT